MATIGRLILCIMSIALTPLVAFVTARDISISAVARKIYCYLYRGLCGRSFTRSFLSSCG